LSTTYISVIGGGLGDIVVALPVIQALIAQGKTALVMRTQRQLGFEKLIPGLAGVIKESELSQQLKSDDRYINLRTHRLQTDYFWGGPEFERDYPGFRINDILSEMCRDIGVEADFSRLTPFKYKVRPELAESVIFIPGTTVDSKTWSTKNWLALKTWLDNRKCPVFMLGQPDYSMAVKELLESGVALIPTPEVEDAVDILSSARSVVSIDTGLMHVAIQQGTPTVSLFQDPIFYRPALNNHALFSKHCEPVCVKSRMAARPESTTEYPEWSWRTSDFKFCLVPEEERCINSIGVSEVVDILDRLALTNLRKA
jgi:hypothetical protein